MPTPPADRAPESDLPHRAAHEPLPQPSVEADQAAAFDRHIDEMVSRIAAVSGDESTRAAAMDEAIRGIIERAKLDPATRDGLAAYEQLKRIQSGAPVDATDVVLERLGIVHNDFVPSGDADVRSRALAAGQGSPAVFRAGLERSVRTIIEDLRGLRRDTPNRRPTDYGRGRPPMSAAA